jgi:hypothetical protein
MGQIDLSLSAYLGFAILDSDAQSGDTGDGPIRTDSERRGKYLRAYEARLRLLVVEASPDPPFVAD